MLNQKQVVVRVSNGSVLLAGGAGVGVMVEPYIDPALPTLIDNLAGTFPVRLRFDGDAAREMIVTDARPRSISGGFQVVHVVADNPVNADGRRFLVTVLETSEDWLGNEGRSSGGPTMRDNAGAVPMVGIGLSGYNGRFVPWGADNESGIPLMTRDLDDHADYLRSDGDGRLSVTLNDRWSGAAPKLATSAGDVPRALLADALGRLIVVGAGNASPASTPPVELLELELFGTAAENFDGHRWLIPAGQDPFYPNGVVDDPAERRGFDVSGFRQLELKVFGYGTVQKRNPALPMTLRVFVEWVIDNDDYNRPTLAEVELAGGVDLTQDGGAVLQLGEGIANTDAGRVTTRGWAPGAIRLRVDATNVNASQYTPSFFVTLTGRV